MKCFFGLLVMASAIEGIVFGTGLIRYSNELKLPDKYVCVSSF